MASGWIPAFVDPPIAAFTRIAFSNAALVMMAEGRRPSRTRPTTTWPARWAVSYRRAATPGPGGPDRRRKPGAPAHHPPVGAGRPARRAPLVRAPRAPAHA